MLPDDPDLPAPDDPDDPVPRRALLAALGGTLAAFGLDACLPPRTRPVAVGPGAAPALAPATPDAGDAADDGAPPAATPALGAHERFNVLDFGALGDGVADDTAALQRALDAAAREGGGTVVVPRGVYRVTRPLELIDDAAHGGARGVRLTSTKGTTSGASDVVLLWDAPAGDAILRLWSRGCHVVALTLGTAPRAAVACAIDITQAPGVGVSGACTDNVVEYCTFNGYAGPMEYGVQIARALVPARGDPGNCDFMTVRKCVFMHLTAAGIFVNNRNQQSKGHTFQDCKFLAMPVGILLYSGSFLAQQCAFGDITETCLRLWGRTDNVLIVNANVESCARFLVCSGLNPGPWPIAVIGGRFDAHDNLAADGRYIGIEHSGPLTLLGCYFTARYSGRFHISANTTLSGATVFAAGCLFPNPEPFARDPRLAGRHVLLANVWSRDGSNTLPMDDALAVFGPAAQRLALSGVRGLSSNATQARNLAGSVTLAGADAVADVRFADPEPDAAYLPTVAVVDVAGTPRPGATRAYVTGRTPQGFRVHLEAAPGAGASATVAWHLLR